MIAALASLATVALVGMLAARIDSRAAGWIAAARQSSYFSEPLYTALDPAFAADLWQGEIGFRLYLRDDVVPEHRQSTVPREAPP